MGSEPPCSAVHLCLCCHECPSAPKGGDFCRPGCQWGWGCRGDLGTRVCVWPCACRAEVPGASPANVPNKADQESCGRAHGGEVSPGVPCVDTNDLRAEPAGSSLSAGSSRNAVGWRPSLEQRWGGGPALFLKSWPVAGEVLGWGDGSQEHRWETHLMRGRGGRRPDLRAQTCCVGSHARGQPML